MTFSCSQKSMKLDLIMSQYSFLRSSCKIIDHYSSHPPFSLRRSYSRSTLPLPIVTSLRSSTVGDLSRSRFFKALTTGNGFCSLLGPSLPTVDTRKGKSTLTMCQKRQLILQSSSGSGFRPFSTGKTNSLENMTVEEKAARFQRPKAQTTIDEEEIDKFSALSALWWDEGGEFEALHSLNELRIPLIRDALVSKKPLNKYTIAQPLEGFWILDVGSGGGILSEPLARLGASVVGVDASEENIKIAQTHLLHDPVIRDRVKYIQCTVEEIAQTQAGKFDAVVASEVLEHVADAETFVTSACQLVRPGGSIFFTTLNKTRLAYYLGIVVAENVLRLVSPGTHDWDKFVSPTDLQYMLDKNNFSTRLVHGMMYNPMSKRWWWSKDTNINYALHAVKPTTDGQDVWTERDESSNP